MTASMDLDDLKQVWQHVDRRLARFEALLADGVRKRRLDAVRASLRPLRWGQMLQIPIGVVFVVWAASTWWAQWPVVNVRVAAFVVHAYGAGLILAGARTLRLLAVLDPATPVVQLQRQLAELQRWYDLSGLVIGMSWWLLWLPVLMMIAGAAGIDLLARAPGHLAMYVAWCLAGLAISLWIVLSRHAGRPRLRALVDDLAGGPSLRRARRLLDEVDRFEGEGATSSASASAD
jgi:hypothetical protein